MITIRGADFITSIADAFQYISYYHPPDFIRALGAAHERENRRRRGTPWPRSW